MKTTEVTYEGVTVWCDYRMDGDAVQVVKVHAGASYKHSDEITALLSDQMLWDMEHQIERGLAVGEEA